MNVLQITGLGITVGWAIGFVATIGTKTPIHALTFLMLVIGISVYIFGTIKRKRKPIRVPTMKIIPTKPNPQRNGHMHIKKKVSGE